MSCGSEKVKEYFNLAAKVYERYVPSRLLQSIVHETLNPIEGPRDKALDAGCGNGCWTGELAERYNHVLGIDIADELVKIAKKKVRKDNVEFRNMNIFDLDEKDFDLVLLVEVVQNIIDRERLFLKLRNFLSKDGCVAIVEKNPYSLYALLTSIRRKLGLVPPHFKSARYPSIESIKRSAIKADLFPAFIVKRKHFYGVVLKKSKSWRKNLTQPPVYDRFLRIFNVQDRLSHFFILLVMDFGYRFSRHEITIF